MRGVLGATHRGRRSPVWQVTWRRWQRLGSPHSPDGCLDFGGNPSVGWFQRTVYREATGKITIRSHMFDALARSTFPVLSQQMLPDAWMVAPNECHEKPGDVSLSCVAGLPIQQLQASQVSLARCRYGCQSFRYILVDSKWGCPPLLRVLQPSKNRLAVHQNVPKCQAMSEFQCVSDRIHALDLRHLRFAAADARGAV